MSASEGGARLSTLASESDGSGNPGAGDEGSGRHEVSWPRRSFRRREIWWGLLGLLAATLWFSSFHSGSSLYVFNTVLLTSIGAVALNFLMGTAGQLSIGNGAFLAVGAMATVMSVRAGLPWPVAIVLSVIASGVFGALAALPAMRLRGFYMALSTLSMHFIVMFIADQYQRRVLGTVGYIAAPALSESGLDEGQRYWSYILAGVLGLVLLGVRSLMNGRSGRAWRLIRDHEIAAPSFGIEVARYKVTAFVISSALIGLQGSLTVYLSGSFDSSTFALAIAIQYVAMVLIGGLDSLAGAVIGAALLAVLPVMVPQLTESIGMAGLVGGGSGAVSQIIYGVLLVVFVVATKDGVVGIVRRSWRRLVPNV